MKFHFDQNGPYVIAKRVVFVLERFKDLIIEGAVKGVSIEAVSIGYDLDPESKQKFFLYHGNAGMVVKTNDPKPLDEIILVNKRDILCFVEPSDGEVAKDKIYLTEIKDPEGEWLHA